MLCPKRHHIRNLTLTPTNAKLDEKLFTIRYFRSLNKSCALPADSELGFATRAVCSMRIVLECFAQRLQILKNNPLLPQTSSLLKELNLTQEEIDTLETLLKNALKIL